MLDPNSRYVSRLTRDTVAVILAGGRGSRLHELTDWRAKPALHFGGKFRIIDFPLSNCVNSGIRRVGILTQYKAHSLIRHIQAGWSHFKKELGEYVEILPASQRYSPNWYQGTADAIYQNMDILAEQSPKYVIVLSGDHVYQMDYGSMLAAHVESGADLTVSCIEVPIEEAAGEFGVMTVDGDNRIVRFDEKPAHPTELADKPGHTLASMGNYIFNADFLFNQLREDASEDDSEHDFGKNIIPKIIDNQKVCAYRFRDHDTGEQSYWRDVGTLDSFWQANMELVEPSPALNLYNHDWPIWTFQKQLPPAKFVFDDDERRGSAVDSMVSGGCIISGGTVRKSLLFSDVRVNSYAEVEESVVLPEVEIGRGAKVRKAIIDAGCKIPENTVIGYDHEHDQARGFRVSKKGVVLVTRKMLGQQEAF
ncbi:glucose-1-phosphate adenylyltransferase [Agaribacterium sp. ZY112]|uniref:glucose-1-phosphate adenylyltransferase n=1 Tax=Agaribacterium sp. ZY112 TaxID=3233574 RepID=UPI003525EAF3